MIFDLISLKNYNSKIEEYVFDDIGLQTLFDDFYDHNWSDLLNIMEYIPNINEIKKRQIIFLDFLNDDSNILNTFRRNLEELRDTHKNYLSIDGGLKSYIKFAQYIEKLIDFIENSNENLSKLDFSSNELNNMKNFFKNKLKEKIYLDLKEDLNNAKTAYKNMEHFIVSYVTNDKYIKTFEFKENQVDLLNEIEELMQKLNIKDDEASLNFVKHDLDAYYFNRLEYIYPNDAKMLKDFFDKYSTKINYDYDTLANELNYYLKIKLLFNHAKEKNVKYTLAKIANDKVTDIKDLADITIINKVDYIQTNDFHYDYLHHMQIVTGANGGGKTTYLRSIGANYIFFCALGWVFASNACIYPIRFLHTHFPNDENYQVGYGRLQDEIRRIEVVKKDFCEDCLYLLNETFSSTDEDTAFKETKKLFKEIEEHHVNMVYITHQQALLKYIDREKVILLNPIVDKRDNNRRTFKIRRVDSKVQAFANDILRKYGLSKDILDEKRRQYNV